MLCIATTTTALFCSAWFRHKMGELDYTVYYWGAKRSWNPPIHSLYSVQSYVDKNTRTKRKLKMVCTVLFLYNMKNVKNNPTRKIIMKNNFYCLFVTRQSHWDIYIQFSSFNKNAYFLNGLFRDFLHCLFINRLQLDPWVKCDEELQL